MSYSTPEPATGPCDALLASLANEEGALEDLLFKLKEQHLVLTSGEHRWLPRTSTEVAAALKAVTVATGLRETTARSTNIALGLAPNATLAKVADHIDDEVACQRIYQRRRSLRDMLDQVQRCSRKNRDLLAGGLAATTDALALLGVSPTYGAAGHLDRRFSGYIGVLDARA